MCTSLFLGATLASDPGSSVARETLFYPLMVAVKDFFCSFRSKVVLLQHPCRYRDLRTALTVPRAGTRSRMQLLTYAKHEDASRVNFMFTPMQGVKYYEWGFGPD